MKLKRKGVAVEVDTRTVTKKLPKVPVGRLINNSIKVEGESPLKAIVGMADNILIAEYKKKKKKKNKK